MNMTHARMSKIKNNIYWNKLEWLVSAGFHFSFFFKLKLNYIKTAHFSFCIKTAIKLYYKWIIKKLKSIHGNIRNIYFELIVKLHYNKTKLIIKRIIIN